MRGRAPILVGILAIAGVVAWLLVRRGSGTPATAPSRTGSSALTTPARAPDRPSLPDEGSPDVTPRPELVPVAPTAEDVFSEETRDNAWATKIEAEIKDRWKQVRGGTLESTECRQSQCKLVVAGSQKDVAQAIADLEGPRGMHGFAANVHLTSPEKRSDGSIALRVFVRFER